MGARKRTVSYTHLDVYKRQGANYYEVVRQLKDVLGANPCPIQIPIGAEAVSYTHLIMTRRYSICPSRGYVSASLIYMVRV